MELLVPLIVGIVVLVVAGLVISRIFKTMWQVAAPNEALIVSGRGGNDGRSYKIVTGGGTFVLPGIQMASRLSLNMHEALLKVECVTSQGIPVVVEGVCIFKVGNDLESITNAASRFLGQEESMDSNVLNLLDGHLRSIIGGMTVEDLLSKRSALTDETRNTSKVEVGALGLIIDSLQIKKIGDPTSYIENLAKPHIATVQQAARIAQAAADQAATIAEQLANAAKAASQAESQIKQAEYTSSIAQAKAIADQQGPLASAKAQQQVIAEQTKMTMLEADRRAKQLEVDVRVPADAEAYKMRVIAEGARAAVIAAAEGKASEITQQGEAEAAIIKAKLLAEADGIAARAAALATNQEAVIAQKLAELMPEIVERAVAPFASIKQLVVTNGGDGLLGMVAGAIAQAGALLPILRTTFAAGAAPTATMPGGPGEIVP